ncbi:hypothetical protein C500_20586 [Natrialba magadii ATCC 43099]|nr:hypothetical protein C500_20586 [Natrialba magadii ATCC 43099]
MDAQESRYGVPADHFDTADEVDDDRDCRPVECTNCGTEYETDGSDACPDCGARRRRYIGPLPGEETDTEPEAVTDGGHTVPEAELVDRAVREAATLIDVGDSERVAIDYVVDEHELEHRRDDILTRVRDRLEQTLAADGGRNAFLTGDAHWCDLCDQPFDSLAELVHHDCDDGQTAIADGGRPHHHATCEDCTWSYSDPDLLEVSDEAEDHARKEMHDVDLQRAVATDGGVAVPTAICYGCTTEVPETDLEQVPSGGTLVEEEVVEHRTRDPTTGERRDTVRRQEYEHTIPKCADCRASGGEQ